MNIFEFVRTLEARKGASIITLTALTEPDWLPLKETGPNPYRGLVKKRSTVNGMICWQYENAVNRQRVREGKEPDFEALPRQWGQRIHGTPWVTHKGKLYLELKLQQVLEVEYVDAETLELVPQAYNWVKRSAGNPRQQLDNEIILRDYTVTNIMSFTYNGETHVLAVE